MRLPAEWERQSFVQLTFPHKDTDWFPILDDVIECYYNIIKSITKYEPVLLLAQDMDLAQSILGNLSNIQILSCKSNDTWSRDHGFITCLDKDTFHFMDFQFNGWGLKYPSNYDNTLNRQLWAKGILKGKYVNNQDFVLEGGSIESDGKGTILTTTSCLLSQNRNSTLSRKEIEDKIKKYFGCKQVLWLESGFLRGDDTDGHIDTLARFCPNNIISYNKCKDRDDEHYEPFSKMEIELSKFRNINGEPYRLISLPFPDAIYDEEGCRLPATYANYLVINGALLYPTYNQPSLDYEAKSCLKQLYPDREIIGIDCKALIRQHGSLHCCTMQYPSI